MAKNKDIFRIKHNNLLPEKGRILISEPFLQNIYFQRAVILLTEHSLKGSMGFVLNKRTDLTVNEFFREFKDVQDIPIYLGGPVNPNHLFFIHTLGNDLIPDSVQITENLCFDGNIEALKSYIVKGGHVEGNVKFFIGYSGWSKNQLNEEIIHDSWLVGKSPVTKMMLSDGETFWYDSIDALGSQYSTWKNYPKNPELN